MARPGHGPISASLHGSGALTRSLMSHGLIDAYHLLVFPVYLGAGTRFFPDGGAPTAFRTAETRTTGTGVVIHTLRPVGPARYGSFELDPADAG